MLHTTRGAWQCSTGTKRTQSYPENRQHCSAAAQYLDDARSIRLAHVWHCVLKILIVAANHTNHIAHTMSSCCRQALTLGLVSKLPPLHCQAQGYVFAVSDMSSNDYINPVCSGGLSCNGGRGVFSFTLQAKQEAVAELSHRHPVGSNSIDGQTHLLTAAEQGCHSVGASD